MFTIISELNRKELAENFTEAIFNKAASQGDLTKEGIVKIIDSIFKNNGNYYKILNTGE